VPTLTISQRIARGDPSLWAERQSEPPQVSKHDSLGLSAGRFGR